MKLKSLLLFTLVTLLLASSSTAFAQEPLPSTWSLPRQGSSIFPVESTAPSVTFTGEQVSALTFGSIANGNFDLGPGVGWVEYSTNGFPLIEPEADLPLYPHSGNYATWLGGGNYETSYIIQYGIPIIKPATLLRLWYIIGSQETVCGNDIGYISIDSNTVYTWNLCNANNNTDWVELTIDLSAYDGTVGHLVIAVVTNGSLNTNLFIDDVSLGGAFTDVSSTHPYFSDIEILYANGLTGGCQTSPLMYCPDQIMDRAQSAVFMMRGTYGSSYVPPGGLSYLFQDNWTPGTWARPWAEAMRSTHLTTGCQPSPLLYCPWVQLPREQLVIFGLKMKYGNNYQPPAATGQVFADLTDTGYYATAWAEKAYADGLIMACGTSGGKPKFCPSELVSRGLGAYVIVRAKNLAMP
jgi:hypothetical protein